MDKKLHANSPRICLLTCYFGKAPWYFGLFAKSCAFNDSVDFYIISDIDFGEDIPPNLKIVRRSLDDIRELALQRFSFPVSISDPYKLCDLKPAYGCLFSDLIAGYDFWGHADLDIIYGDIRAMILDEMLNYYDVISVREEYVTGFFSLFRNTEQVCNLFRNSRDYQRVFQDPDDYSFDECNWQWEPLLKGKTIFQLENTTQSMTYVVKRHSFCGDIKARFLTIVNEDTLGELEWDHGKLYFKKEMILLYHLVRFKDLPYIYLPKWKTIPDRFYINSFYFSRRDPASFTGQLEGCVLAYWKSIYRKLQRGRQFIKWLGDYLYASSKLKPGCTVSPDDILGVYRFANYLEVEVFQDKGRLFARWKNNETAPLRHLEKNSFVVGRFCMEKAINIRIEFHYDPVRRKRALSVRPFHVRKYTLFKENEVEEQVRHFHLPAVQRRP